MQIYLDMIAFFGSQKKMAKAIKVSQANVSYYATGKQHMSEITALRAEKATGGKFKAIDLCPALQEFENEKTASGH